jgi:hypothetical protein
MLFDRKKTKFLEMKEKTKIAESILRYKFNWNFKNTINKKKKCITYEITTINPDGFHSSGQVVHYRMYEDSEKVNEKNLFELCERTYNDRPRLNKHLKKKHAMEFANSISNSDKIGYAKHPSSFALDVKHRLWDREIRSVIGSRIFNISSIFFFK